MVSSDYLFAVAEATLAASTPATEDGGASSGAARAEAQRLASEAAVVAARKIVGKTSDTSLQAAIRGWARMGVITKARERVGVGVYRLSSRYEVVQVVAGAAVVVVGEREKAHSD